MGEGIRTNRLVIFTFIVTLLTIRLLFKAPGLWPYIVFQQFVLWSLTIFLHLKKEAVFYSLARIRNRPVLFFYLILMLFSVGLILWGSSFTKGMQRIILISFFWFCILFIFAGQSAVEIKSTFRNFSRSGKAGPFLTLTTIILVLAAIEIILRFSSLTSQWCPIATVGWYSKFWRPVNVEGYRDYQIPKQVPPGVKRVVVVGDSFAAGEGTRYMDDTFPQVLRRKLGKAFTVNIVANPGYDTTDEWIRLNKFPVKPDYLILSYVYNDLDYLLVDQNKFVKRSDLTKSIIRTYYIANFLYWSAWRAFILRGSPNYDKNIRRAYSDSSSWGIQEQNLQKFIDYAKARHCRLIVLVWPMLNHLEDTEIQDKVTQWFQKQNIEIANVLPFFKNLPLSDLTVNFSDNHPSVLSHKITADVLYRQIISN